MDIKRRLSIAQDAQDLAKPLAYLDPKLALEERGVKLIAFKKPTKLLGMYKIIKRNRFVFYNPFVKEEIKKMVLAHELGHDFYHRKEARQTELLEYELFNLQDQLELEANLFAANFLIPEEQILEQVESGQGFQELAQILKVDPNLLLLRLDDLKIRGLIDFTLPTANPCFFQEIDPHLPHNLDSLAEA